MSSFFLDEADVADDDEEEEVDAEERERGDERVMPEDERAAIEAVRRRHELNRKFNAMSDAEIAADIERRHRVYEQNRAPADNAYGGGEGGFVPVGSVMQQALLPTTSDPGIWMVRVSNGKEALVVRSIMLKSMEALSKGSRQTIKSAFCTSSKGYVYIEAIAEPFAREVINGLRMVLQYTFTKVPLDQMTSLLSVTVRKQPMKKGQLVRFKRGPLKGDLAIVLDLLEGGEKAFVQAVPRPDYSEKAEGKKAASNARPQQRLLDIEEARKHGLPVDRKRHPTYRSLELYDFFNGEYYKKGYLMKEVNVATYLTATDVNPKLSELRMFQEVKSRNDDDAYDSVTGEDQDEVVDQMSSSLSAVKELTEHLKGVEDDKKVTFQVGDIVQVVGGELINLIGQVVSMDPISRLVKLRALNETANADITVEASLLIKHIKPGQHVKVMSGPNLGQTGRVVNVSSLNGENLAYVLTDGTKAEITCNVEHLQISEEVNQGLDSLMGYELYDLVEVSTSEVAVVIRVGAETLRLLTHTGIVKELRPLELIGKRNVRASSLSALDSLSAQVSIGDTVKVKDGKRRAFAPLDLMFSQDFSKIKLELLNIFTKLRYFYTRRRTTRTRVSFLFDQEVAFCWGKRRRLQLIISRCLHPKPIQRELITKRISIKWSGLSKVLTKD